MCEAVQENRKGNTMKKSTTFALVAIGIASLCATVALPASADDNTPVTNGTGNCSTARDQAPNKKCLTKPKEGQKPDQDADARTKIKIGVKYGEGSATNGKPSPFGQGRTAPSVPAMQSGDWTDVLYTKPGGGTGVKSIYLGSAGILAYYGSSTGLHSTALQSGRGGGGRK